jgi:hypothetical protein
MIIALAGRRIDADGTEAVRFPLSNIDKVKEKLKTLFISLTPKALVCSGACGADLLALEVAGELKINRRMVLPFEQSLFKSSSVTDRPGNWGDLFDRIFNEVNKEEKVLVLEYPKNDDESYRKTNIDILNEAGNLAEKYGHPGNLAAVIVWEGQPKTENDTTEQFMNEAQSRGFEIKIITTK